MPLRSQNVSLQYISWHSLLLLCCLKPYHVIPLCFFIGLRGADIQNIAEAMALLEAEAGVIMDMVGRRDRADQAPRAQASIESNESTSQGAESAEGGPTPMDVDGASTSEGSSDANKKPPEEEYTLPRLSEQLSLEELWETLGDCLSQLAKTPDNHAVLVLQPAVEAFFIVHAGKFRFTDAEYVAYFMQCFVVKK